MANGRQSRSRWRCNLCPKTYKCKTFLMQHYNIHTGEKPYLCRVPGCNMAFPYAFSRDRHQRNDGLHPLAIDNTALPVNYSMLSEEFHGVESNNDIPFAPSSNWGDEPRNMAGDNSLPNIHSAYPTAYHGPAEEDFHQAYAHASTRLSDMATVPPFGPDRPMTMDSAQLHHSHHFSPDSVAQPRGMLPMSRPEVVTVRQTFNDNTNRSVVDSRNRSSAEARAPEREGFRRR